MHIGLVLDRLDTKPAVKLVALILADHADADGICWPSYRRIAERSCLDSRTIRRHVHTLQSMGVVRRLRTGTLVRLSDRTMRISNAYQIDADALKDMPSLLSTGTSAQLDSLDHLQVDTAGRSRWSRLTTKPSREPSTQPSPDKNCG